MVLGVLWSIFVEILIDLILVTQFVTVKLSILIYASSSWLSILGAADGYVLLVTYD